MQIESIVSWDYSCTALRWAEKLSAGGMQPDLSLLVSADPFAKAVPIMLFKKISFENEHIDYFMLIFADEGAERRECSLVAIIDQNVAKRQNGREMSPPQFWKGGERGISARGNWSRPVIKNDK